MKSCISLLLTRHHISSYFVHKAKTTNIHKRQMRLNITSFRIFIAWFLAVHSLVTSAILPSVWYSRLAHKWSWTVLIFDWDTYILLVFAGADKQLYQYIIPNSNGGSRCSICGKTGTSRSNLRMHVENMHFAGSFTHECKYCSEEFDTKTKLNNHVMRVCKKSSMWYMKTGLGKSLDNALKRCKKFE